MRYNSTVKVQSRGSSMRRVWLDNPLHSYLPMQLFAFQIVFKPSSGFSKGKKSAKLCQKMVKIQTKTQRIRHAFSSVFNQSGSEWG
mmetsp:Transcript_10129/g.20473  ORF Transcript_10129/g.20473 Transcript_10129/m.20473 type:complete len:86 (+) Transcript_10129:730-987(+)